MMDWRNRIVEGYQNRAHEMRPDFREGATEEQISSLEGQLGCQLPRPLRELLGQSDGVRESMCYGGSWFEIYTPVWSCEEISAHCRAKLTGDEHCPPRLDPSKTPVYFAAASADGVVFAFMVGPSGTEDPAVYGYYPIDDRWRRISVSLEAHLHGWKI
jgi:hypothetical protein